MRRASGVAANKSVEHSQLASLRKAWRIPYTTGLTGFKINATFYLFYSIIMTITGLLSKEEHDQYFELGYVLKHNVFRPDELLDSIVAVDKVTRCSHSSACSFSFSRFIYLVLIINFIIL